MSHSLENVLGAAILLALLAVFVGGPLYVMHKVMPRINRARRKREIEVAMRTGVLDRQLIGEVSDKLYREQEGKA